MYEDETVETILNRMLGRVPDTINKTEGSLIYDAIAPAAVELAQAYLELEAVSRSFALDTASGDALTELCYQNGTFRKSATNAVRKGVFNVAVPIGSKFIGGNNIYVVLKNITGFEYEIECEDAGEVGNSYIGSITPVEYIEGLTSAMLTSVLISGAEEETDEQLRERHRQKITSPPQDGNVAQYKAWAEANENIGVAKVFPLWNGGNTVKVAITNRLYQVAESSLVSEFQEYLDPGSAGLGNGVAPIGTKVTVSGGAAKNIDVVGNIVLAEGYTEPEGVADIIRDYFASITFVKDSVNYIRVAAAVIDAPSIASLSNFTVNGGTVDVALVGEEIPVLNSLSLTVVS